MENAITVLIHTYNEDSNIKECINSAMTLTNNILVIDMHSTDKTAAIIHEMGYPLISFPYSLYVEPAREFAIRQAKTDWVLILDADERITVELAEEIKTAIKNQQYSHYKIPRKNIFAKCKWLRNGGWWPDYQTRLVNRKYLKSWPKVIHSTPVIDGICSYLKNPLIHYFHGNIEKMVNKTLVFEDIESDLLYNAKRNSNTTIFFRKFFGELNRRLFKNLGFLDGKIGIIESIYQAFSKTITYLYLYEKKNSRSV